MGTVESFERLLPAGATSLDRDAAAELRQELGPEAWITALVRLADERSGAEPLHFAVSEELLAEGITDVDLDSLLDLWRVHLDPTTPFLVEWVLSQLPQDDLVARLDAISPAERRGLGNELAILVDRAPWLRGEPLTGLGDGGEEAAVGAEPDEGSLGLDEPVEATAGEDEPTANGGQHAKPPAPDEPRWLQAAIGDPDTSLTDHRRAFRADAPNEIAVLIDVVRDDSMLAAVGPDKGASIDAQLEAGTHDLTVLFQIPSLHVAQTQPIKLPPEGPSETATFTFDAPAAGQKVDAMVTVLHANRALQAATLSAFCLQDPTNVPPGFEATFRFEAIRPGTAGIEERQPFDAAVVARGGKDGPGAAGFTDGTPLAFDDKVLGPIADRIRTALRKLADDAASFTAGLTADASVALLRQLAFQGRDLYDLVGKPLEDARPGAPLDRIQVVVTDTEAFIPVEFIYDLPAPTLDAGLCANARKALRDGRCDPANHPDGDLPGTSSVVCPIGFWALRKVVERQVVGTRDDDALKDRDFAIRAEVTRRAARARRAHARRRRVERPRRPGRRGSEQARGQGARADDAQADRGREDLEGMGRGDRQGRPAAPRAPLAHGHRPGHERARDRSGRRRQPVPPGAAGAPVREAQAGGCADGADARLRHRRRPRRARVLHRTGP